MITYKQVRLQPETHKELKVFAAIRDISLSKAVKLLLKESKER